MLYLSSVTVSFILCLVFIFNSAAGTNEVIAPIQEFEIILGDSLNIEFQIRNHSETEPKNATLIFKPSDYITYPLYVDVKNWTAHLLATGVHPVFGAVVEAVNCTVRGSEKCDLDISEAFVRVSVIRSKFLSALVQIVGWSYFIAWIISFYPQILLNFKRKSVIGLNFDFLELNLVGFGAYSLYNLIMYFSEHVKQIYHFENPRSPPPVLTNDVVFAVHAFFACAVTVVQSFIYERENQRVSKKCIVRIIVYLVFGTVSAVASVFNKISILQFVSNLCYIKMTVTCSKYFPKVYMNYLRKSTNGWSIGNALFDLTGGTQNILPMVFQALNVGFWTKVIVKPVQSGIVLNAKISFHYILLMSLAILMIKLPTVESSPLICQQDFIEKYKIGKMIQSATFKISKNGWKIVKSEYHEDKNAFSTPAQSVMNFLINNEERINSFLEFGNSIGELSQMLSEQYCRTIKKSLLEIKNSKGSNKCVYSLPQKKINDFISSVIERCSPVIAIGLTDGVIIGVKTPIYGQKRTFHTELNFHRSNLIAAVGLLEDTTFVLNYIFTQDAAINELICNLSDILHFEELLGIENTATTVFAKFDKLKGGSVVVVEANGNIYEDTFVVLGRNSISVRKNWNYYDASEEDVTFQIFEVLSSDDNYGSEIKIFKLGRIFKEFSISDLRNKQTRQDL